MIGEKMNQMRNFIGWGNLLSLLIIDLLVVIVSIVVISVLVFKSAIFLSTGTLTLLSILAIVLALVLGVYLFVIGLLGLQKAWTENMFLLKLDKKGYPFLYGSTYGQVPMTNPNHNWLKLSKEQLMYIIKFAPKNHVLIRLAKGYLDDFDQKKVWLIDKT